MKGEVVYLYAFDVANEILTARVPAALARKPAPFAVRLERAPPRGVPLYQPLTIEPPPPAATLGGRPVRLLVRVYGVGVITVAARVGFERGAVTDLIPFHRPTLDCGRALDRVARDLCAEVCRGLREFLVRGSPPSEPEAYTVFCLTEIPGVDDVGRWLAGQRAAVAGLLSETDPGRLGEGQVGEALRLQRSFEKTDLVVID